MSRLKNIYNVLLVQLYSNSSVVRSVYTVLYIIYCMYVAYRVVLSNALLYVLNITCKYGTSENVES